VKVCTDTAEDIAALETKIMSVEAHNVDVAAAGDLIKDLAGLCALFVCNIQKIGALCLPMPESEHRAPRRLLASWKCLLV
jgi:hypothetical protein